MTTKYLFIKQRLIRKSVENGNDLIINYGCDNKNQ